jgi:hypothetical protein
MNAHFGKVLILLGVLLVFVGLIWTFRPHIPWLGRLPGDVYVKRDNFQFYFPLATCILISLLLSFLFRLFRR